MLHKLILLCKSKKIKDAQSKVDFVMSEFKAGKLQDSAGNTVTDIAQAKAIAFSEAEKLHKSKLPQPIGTENPISSGKVEKKVAPNKWTIVPKGTKGGGADKKETDGLQKKGVDPVQAFKEKGNLKEVLKDMKDIDVVKLFNDISEKSNHPWANNRNVQNIISEHLASKKLISKEGAQLVSMIGKVPMGEISKKLWNIPPGNSPMANEALHRMVNKRILAKSMEFIHNLFFKSKSVEEMGDSKFDKVQLEAGIKVEMEHVPDLLPKDATDEEKRHLACKVAKRHLTESKTYYIDLKKYVE